MKSPLTRGIVSLALTLCCIMAGYGYYKMNPHDGWVAVVFTIGISGIMLSVLRNAKR